MLQRRSNQTNAKDDDTHYVSRRGYVVRKDCLKPGEEARIRKDLVVSPFNPMQSKFGPGAGGAEPVRFRVFQESANRFYLPRFYGVSVFGPATEDRLAPAKDAGVEPIDALFHGSLRQPQVDVAEAAIARLATDGGGLLQLRCGFGKTILALYILTRMKVKTLVVVHKEFLLNQWRERIEQFLPDVSVGYIQQKVVNTEGKQVVIAMLQSVSMRDYDADVFRPFGLTIFDECHHLGAEQFSKALQKTSTRYMLGLSATPDRKDGLRRVFEWYIGTVVASVTDGDARFTNVRVRVVRFQDKAVRGSVGGRLTIATHKHGEVAYRDHPAQRMQLLQHLVDSAERTALIARIVAALDASEGEAGRRTLVLSERRAHLEAIGAALDADGIECGFYWGGVKQSALDAAAEKRVIMGTYHMASEGMDIPALNAVVLASPKSDVKQSVGRILRKRDHPVAPVIVDLIDARLPCFSRLFASRRRLYNKSGFRIVECGSDGVDSHGDVNSDDGNGDGAEEAIVRNNHTDDKPAEFAFVD